MVNIQSYQIYLKEKTFVKDILLSGVHGVDPTKSVAGVKCVDIVETFVTDYEWI